MIQKLITWWNRQWLTDSDIERLAYVEKRVAAILGEMDNCTLQQLCNLRKVALSLLDTYSTYPDCAKRINSLIVQLDGYINEFTFDESGIYHS